MRGAAGGGCGAETIGGGLDDEDVRDEAEGELAAPVDRLGGAILPRASVLTSTARSFLLTSRSTRSRLRTVPRGMPNPADPGVMVTRCATPAGGLTVSPRPSITVARPRTGGRGTGVRRGGFTTRGTAYQLFQ